MCDPNHTRFVYPQKSSDFILTAATIETKVIFRFRKTNRDRPRIQRRIGPKRFSG